MEIETKRPFTQRKSLLIGEGRSRFASIVAHDFVVAHAERDLCSREQLRAREEEKDRAVREFFFFPPPPPPPPLLLLPVPPFPSCP